MCSRSIPQGLQRGDQLLAVNGIDVAEKSHDHVIDCIARERSSGRLQLTVLRVPGLAQDWEPQAIAELGLWLFIF